MPLLPPRNDTECLSLLMEEAKRLSKLPSVRAFAANFDDIGELVEYIRGLEQRDDLGDLWDGPRLPCTISQRIRFAPSDPNCFERVLLFLAVALLIDPTLNLTAASMIINEGWHTFPIMVHRNGVEDVIVLDPYTTPPRNAMAATASMTRNGLPMTRANIAPWSHTLIRNACLDEGTEDCYERAMRTLRNGLITGEPIEDVEDINYVLELAAEDAELWGAPGRRAYNRLHTSVRNLSLGLGTGQVREFLDSLIKTSEKLAPDAQKAALIAQYGPAAAIAMQGVELAMVQQTDDSGDSSNAKQKAGESSKQAETTDKSKLTPIQRLRRSAWRFAETLK